MKLSKTMKRVLLELLDDHDHGRKISTGNGDGLACRLGACEPNKYHTGTTWALRTRGLLGTGQASEHTNGAPIWRLTEEGVRVARDLKQQVEEEEESRLREEYNQDVVESAESNHIWANAFTLVNPSDKTFLEIGKAVVGMWNQPENRIKAAYARDEGEPRGITSFGDVMILKFNAS